MNRRGFLGSILAACAAPAIVRADSLMRIVPMDALVLRVGDAFTMDEWVGAVREIKAWDITRDVMLTRWDVAGVGRNGQFAQIGIDMQNATAADRALALSLLKNAALRDGLTPQRGRLVIPEGVTRGQFL